MNPPTEKENTENEANAKISRVLRKFRFIYLLTGAGLFFAYSYFWDKPFTWQTIIKDLSKVRLYVGLLLALLASLAMEVTALKITRLAQVPALLIVIRWALFLLIFVVYLSVK